MDKEIMVAIIGGIVTIIVGVITAIAGYKGGIKGAQLQIEKDQEKINTERDAYRRKRQAEYNQEISYRRGVIERIISHEIQDNFMKIKSDFLEEEILYSGDSWSAISYYFNTELRFAEFDKVKYDLIKFQSEKVSEVMDIYDAFKIIVRRKQLVNFKSEEIHKVRKAYLMCKKNYC
ncbi:MULTISPECIES: hypothetical protein [Bacillus]|uniref:hypothetical protein n=1 Tax=Bacillus TaxID=1386 RepID=UPI001331A60B|nr:MULTISPECIES: hypothetical protein [Bacillus amyloliquefaciens group]